MNIIKKSHNYVFYRDGVINTIGKLGIKNIYANKIYSTSYDNGEYNKTIIITHEFMYKQDYMLKLVNNLVKNNCRVILYDLTGHNTCSSTYKNFPVPSKDTNTFTLTEDFLSSDNYQNYDYDHYDFNGDGLSFLSTILIDYNLLNNRDANIFILGHSIGSLINFSNLIKSLGSWSNSEENFIRGAISLSPNLKDLRYDNLLFYNILSFLWPGFKLSNKLIFENNDKFLLNDLYDKKFTANSINYILLLQDFIFNNHGHNITVPNLFFHSKDDKISSYEHSLQFFNQINSEKKEFISYESGGHNLFIGDKCEEISNKINSWINNILI